MTNALDERKLHRIDVHHHVWSPAYLSATGSTIPWSPEKSIEDMDKAGIATAITSITQPGIWFGDKDKARTAARECNEYGAGLVRDYPGRFGLFAALPLPDPEGSLRELEYAMDVLKADGIGLPTSYGDKWLGDPLFEPVFEEMNRRKVVIYTHPIAPTCCRNLVPDIGDGVIEWATDTTRAISRVLFSGTAARYPNIDYIWSHGGGTAPFLLGRLIGQAASPAMAERLPNGLMPELQRFYYDIAQAAHQGALSALRSMVPISQVVFGTDFPYRTGEQHVKALSEYDFSESDLRAIDCENVLRLLPAIRSKVESAAR